MKKITIEQIIQEYKEEKIVKSEKKIKEILNLELKKQNNNYLKQLYIDQILLLPNPEKYLSIFKENNVQISDKTSIELIKNKKFSFVLYLNNKPDELIKRIDNSLTINEICDYFIYIRKNKPKIKTDLDFFSTYKINGKLSSFKLLSKEKIEENFLKINKLNNEKIDFYNSPNFLQWIYKTKQILSKTENTQECFTNLKMHYLDNLFCGNYIYLMYSDDTINKKQEIFNFYLNLLVKFSDEVKQSLKLNRYEQYNYLLLFLDKEKSKKYLESIPPDKNISKIISLKEKFLLLSNENLIQNLNKKEKFKL